MYLLQLDQKFLCLSLSFKTLWLHVPVAEMICDKDSACFNQPIVRSWVLALNQDVHSMFPVIFFLRKSLGRQISISVISWFWAVRRSDWRCQYTTLPAFADSYHELHTVEQTLDVSIQQQTIQWKNPFNIIKWWNNEGTILRLRIWADECECEWADIASIAFPGTHLLLLLSTILLTFLFVFSLVSICIEIYYTFSVKHRYLLLLSSATVLLTFHFFSPSDPPFISLQSSFLSTPKLNPSISSWFP